MQKIVIIGGGLLRKDTHALDKRIIKLTGKKHPKALFIPTASSDSEKYCKIFANVYGKKYGCKVEVLRLIKQSPSKTKIRKIILASDLIYVGGGNTLMMMRRWRRLGVDKALQIAHKRGIVLSGLSAGGICWFESGHSDSMSFYHPKRWKYIKVKGLGVLKGIHCPHFNSATKGKKRREDFVRFMKKHSGVGIAIDNHCAIEFIGNSYRVVSIRPRSNAYRVFRQKGKVAIEEIPAQKELRKASELYKMN